MLGEAGATSNRTQWGRLIGAIATHQDRNAFAARSVGKARHQCGRWADQQVGFAGECTGARKHGVESYSRTRSFNDDPKFIAVLSSILGTS